MANLVLYRKYRPKTFSEFIGQEHIVRTVTNAITNDMVAHAYLFAGPRGTGKTTLARLLAKAVNCENLKGFEPCNKCASCLEINHGRAMDLVEIDAASQTGVDNIRDLKEGIRFVPSKLKYKVFIIDECHQLSKGASNALLKTLEEPPSHAIFILATTEVHKMLATILSRCQRFDFRKLRVPEIIKKLERDMKEEGMGIKKPALQLIAQNARGSIRDAESLLDQVLSFSNQTGGEIIKASDAKDILGLVEISLIKQFTDFLIQKEQKQAIKFLNETLEQGLDIQVFIKALISYLRQGLLLKVGTKKEFAAPELTDDEVEKLISQFKDIKQENILEIIEDFLEAASQIRYSSIPQLPIELATIKACEIL